MNIICMPAKAGKDFATPETGVGEVFIFKNEIIIE